MTEYTKIATLKGIGAFRESLAALGIDLPVDDNVASGAASPLARPLTIDGRLIGNRFAVQPMEGWDGTPDGRPTDHTRRRWRRFGQSGAKLIWGGEAVAVRHDGRANPNQLVLDAGTESEIATLREELVRSHREAVGSDDGLVVGLQLTHSGRFSRPNGQRLEPCILYRHPLLDRKFGVPADYPLMTDGEIERLVEDMALAARRAQACGFDFVDVKHCHGYLGHEFLSAVTRPGRYGGSMANRTRFLRETVQAIRSAAPGLRIGVRVSAFDMVPFKPDPEQSKPGRLGPGVPETYCDCMPYAYAFGCNADQPTDIDLAEPVLLFEQFRELGIRLVNVTAGSPYYTPHIQRPALYPPCDGYQPPEDPLIGVARQVSVVRYLKELFPDIAMVGTAYTYLQEFLPNVAQGVVRSGWTDFVGLGRMVLAYPELPHDILEGRPVRTKSLCRTFSDCTTAPRNGLVSGCYPLDAYYKKSVQAGQLAAAKRAAKE